MRASKVAALVVVSGKPSAATLKKQRIMSAAAAHLACVVWADDAAVIQWRMSEIMSMTCFLKLETWICNCWKLNQTWKHPQRCISAPSLLRPGAHLELFLLSPFMENEQTLRRPMLHRLRHPPHFSTFQLGTVPSLLVLHSHRCCSNIMSSALTFVQLKSL